MRSMLRRLTSLIVCVSILPAQAGSGSKVVTMMLTNDMHGRIVTDEPAKGLAILGTLVEEARRDAPDLLLFDAGDTISGQPNSLVTKGQAIVACMNALGFDAMVVGNHEFDQNHETAQEALGNAEFAVLSVNTFDTAADRGRWNAVQPYRVFEVHGVRVGVFGLTTMYTMAYEYPRWMGSVEVEDPFAHAQKTVDHLRNQEKVDLVVSLNHLGYKVDRQLAELVDGIDIILGGHSHTFLDEPVFVGDTLIMQAGSHSRAIGRVDVLMDPGPEGQGYVVSTINGRDGRWWGYNGVDKPASQLGDRVAFPSTILLRPAPETPASSTVLAAYEPFREAVEAYLNEPLGVISEAIHAEGHTHAETPMGNLIADAVRWRANTDIAVYLANQFRSLTLEAGTVTRRDLFELMGSYTRQHIVAIESPGFLVKDMLQKSIDRDGTVVFYVSGVRLTPDPVLDDGSRIEDRRRYTVAGAAHVMQDYFIGEPGVKILDDSLTAEVCREALAQYLLHLGTVSPPTGDRLGAAAEAAAVAP